MTCLRFTKTGRVILRVCVRSIMTDLRRTIKDFSQECLFTQWSPKLTCSGAEQTIPFSGAEFLKHHLKVGMIFSWAFGKNWLHMISIKTQIFQVQERHSVYSWEATNDFEKKVDNPNKNSRYALWYQWKIVFLYGCQTSLWKNLVSL